MAGLAIVLDEGRPNSTQEVSVIGDNLARVPQGETVVFIYTNRPQEVWEITHGDNVITATCSPCVDPPPATLCGVGCEITISAGVVNKFRVRLREDGAVELAWPDGWTYRPYRP